MEKKYIVSVSYVTIGELLNTNELKPHLSKYWCIPKQNDPAFVANMEDGLAFTSAHTAKTSRLSA